MTLGVLPFSGAKKIRRAAAVVSVAAVAAAVAGMGTAPAQSATAPPCFTEFPLADVAPDQPVQAFSVTKGTTPTTFDGTTIGVLHDGIAPGLDMILVDFGSTDPANQTAVDKYGIWEGMSGSPVYENGKLLGAIAYSLAAGNSPVAGITPAGEMARLLETAPSSATALNAQVSIPTAMQRKIASSGAASYAELDGGLTQLREPFSVTGVTDRTRFRQFSKALGLPNGTRLASGSVGRASTDYPLTAGGNVAASVSYGDITVAGLGTATAVCPDGQVLAFGHPMNFTGTSTMSMHGADALFVQGANEASFKVANLGAPDGTVTGDHLAGLRGILGTFPRTTSVTSYVEVGDRARDGVTQISVPDAVPDIAVAHVVADQDRILDGLGGGSGRFRWDILLTQKDGTQFHLHRSDAYADPGDLSYTTVFGLAEMLYTIQSGSFGATIDSVSTRSVLSHQYSRYTVAKVQLRRHGAWHRLSEYRVVRLRAGTTARLRVVLSSQELGRRLVRTDLRVPLHAGNKVASLRVFGGSSTGDVQDVFAQSSDAAFGAPAAPSLEDLAAQLRSTPHNEDVVSDLTWFEPRSGLPTNHQRTRVAAGHVVDGSVTFQVRGVPAGR